MVGFEHFSRLVHEIYHATVDPNRWSVALEKISAAVPAESVRVDQNRGLGGAALAISLTTVRTHLQHVLEKTDTHRQAEPVRLLLRSIAATRHP